MLILKPLFDTNADPCTPAADIATRANVIADVFDAVATNGIIFYYYFPLFLQVSLTLLVCLVVVVGVFAIALFVLLLFYFYNFNR